MSTKTETASSQESVVNALDLSVLGQLYSRCLIDALERIIGPKTLVIDPAIAGVLGLVVEVPALKAHGVDRMFYLEPGPLHQAQRNIVYLATADPALMHILSDQVKEMDSNKFTHTLLMIPRINTVCTSILQDNGVYGQIDIEAFPLELIPLEKDVLSLEVPDSYKSIFLDGDFTCVYDLARSLMTLQKAFGSIPRIAGKGDSAQRLVSLLQRLRKEQSSESIPAKGPIDSLIILDRQVDMVTPLCTQLTYEGLIDELVGIRNSHVEVDPDLVNPPPNNLPSPSTALTNISAPAKKKKIHLQSANDSLFADLRDKNFAVVGPILNRVARRINADYESRHTAMAGSVTQMRSFVGKLSGLQAESQALRLHTGLTEQIMQTTMTDEFNKALEIQQNVVAGLDLTQQEQGIRDLINQEARFKTVLRLICLLSLVQGGYKPKVFEDLEKEVLQTYGYNFLSTLISLNSLGLLTKSLASTKSPFAIARKSLRLIVDDVDESNPEDIAYVYSGYAPLSARLVQGALGRNGSFLGWKSIEDVVKSLPGKTVEATQKVAEHAAPPAALTSSADAGPVTLVCFLGGCTYTEISALRWISQQGRGGRRIVIVTTGIISGNSLLSSLVPKGLHS